MTELQKLDMKDVMQEQFDKKPDLLTNWFRRNVNGASRTNV